MNQTELRILQTVYSLSDDIDYNLYEAEDIAEYSKLDQSIVDEQLKSLFTDGYLGECMSMDDDGMETFHLTHKGMQALNNEL
jgi:DNA-binding MarR family transcriptional regulator